MSQEAEGETYTITLLSELHAECARLSRDLSDAGERLHGLMRQLSNPNLPDIPLFMPYRVEQWDKNDVRVSWTISANTSVAVAQGAFEAAVAWYPNDRWTLRHGARVLSKHDPKETKRL